MSFLRVGVSSNAELANLEIHVISRVTVQHYTTCLETPEQIRVVRAFNETTASYLLVCSGRSKWRSVSPLICTGAWSSQPGSG